MIPNPLNRSTRLWRTALPLLINLLIVLAGIRAILQRVGETRVDDAATILTPDEIRAQPEGTVVAVLAKASEDYDDGRLDFVLLKLVLEKSGKPFVMGYGQNVVGSTRASRNIASAINPGKENPEGLTVTLTGLGSEGEGDLASIAIPATGGLLGLRVPCINSERPDLLRNVRGLQDLRSFLAVQGRGWMDAKILRDAGIPTFEVDSNLTHNLLNEGRVDYFPRSVTSVEMECHGGQSTFQNVIMDPYLVVVHPAAWIFYVHPDNESLREAIEEGFNQALEDGSYVQLLRERVFTPWLRETLDLPNRRVVYVPSEFGRELTAMIDERYWMLPWSQLERGEITTGAQLCGLPVIEYLCDDRAKILDP
jgi:hypothetical protein